VIPVLGEKRNVALGYADYGDRTIYLIIVNEEGQYSMWPANRQVPVGWRSVGKTGMRQECFRHISALMNREGTKPSVSTAADEESS
jgi:MbtH protein